MRHTRIHQTTAAGLLGAAALLAAGCTDGSAAADEPDAHAVAESMRLDTTLRVENGGRTADQSYATIYDSTVECDGECEAWGGPRAVDVRRFRTDELAAAAVPTGDNPSPRGGPGKRVGTLVVQCSTHLPAVVCQKYLDKVR